MPDNINGLGMLGLHESTALVKRAITNMGAKFNYSGDKN